MIDDRDAIHCVGVPPFLDGSIIEFTANVQCSQRLALEILVHPELVLEGFHFYVLYIVSLMNQEFSTLTHCICKFSFFYFLREHIEGGSFPATS